MTEAMPFLQKAILLSYAPRSLPGESFLNASIRQSGGLPISDSPLFVIRFRLTAFFIVCAQLRICDRGDDAVPGK